MSRGVPSAVRKERIDVKGVRSWCDAKDTNSSLACSIWTSFEVIAETIIPPIGFRAKIINGDEVPDHRY